MKKQTIVILSILSVIVVPFAFGNERLSTYSLQSLIFMPVQVIYDIIIYFGSSGNGFGNVIAWLILISMSLIPLFIVFRFKRTLLDEKGVIFLILSIVSLILSIFYFGNHFKIYYLGSEVVYRIAFLMSASMWYFSYLVILYEMYLRKYEGADEAMRILSIVIGLVIAYLVFDFSLKSIKAVSLLDYEYGRFNIIASDIFNALFYSIKTMLLIRLLWLFNEAMILPVKDWFSSSFADVLAKIKKVSKRLLSFAIYYPILQIFVRFIGLNGSLDPEFSVNFPLFEILLALIIIVISEIIMYGINYKEENESFV